LPHATEDIKWGADLIFSVGGKMFAGFDASGRDASFGCKVSESDFDALIRVEGIKPAAYAARFHWIDVEDPGLLPEAEAKALIRGSYDLVKAKLPKKLQAQIGGPSHKVDKRAAPKKRNR
jgi:predicted DNA-binding protein (MmcQ/YjbR family)